MVLSLHGTVAAEPLECDKLYQRPLPSIPG
jgi:hypothetical protein